MSDWGGTQKTKTKATTGVIDPQAEALQALRLSLAQGVASGDWSGMKGFFDKVLIPRTTNTLTAAGLGRSGAVGEAVTNAQLEYGTDFLRSLLSGVPSAYGRTGETQTSQYQPGPMDWLQLALSLGSMAMGKA